MFRVLPTTLVRRLRELALIFRTPKKVYDSRFRVTVYNLANQARRAAQVAGAHVVRS